VLLLFGLSLLMPLLLLPERGAPRRTCRRPGAPGALLLSARTGQAGRGGGPWFPYPFGKQQPEK